MTASQDHALEIRERFITRLKDGVNVSSIVDGRVYDYPPDEVVWPFIRYGGLHTEPYEASCMLGSSHRVVVHGFAKGPSTDEAVLLGQAIEIDLRDDDVGTALEVVDYQWLGTDVMPDPVEPGAYHVLVNFLVIVVEVSHFAMT